MDLSSEELGRSSSGDIFYDFIPPPPPILIKSELTPISYIGSSPTSASSPLNGPDPNNNINGTIIKSFIDEMLFADSSLLPNDDLQNGSHSFSLLPTPFQWTVDEGSPETDTHWLAQTDGTPIPTFTNLLDPIFVTFQDGSEDIDSPCESQHSDKNPPPTYMTNEVVVSSSTAFHLSPLHEPVVTWVQDGDLSTTNGFHESESSTLLRSALEGTRTLSPLPPIVTLVSKNDGDSELRKVLSYPPILIGTEHSPPTSTSSTNLHTLPLPSSIGDGEEYFEFHIMDGRSSGYGIGGVMDDTLIPNSVEELIMTRLEPSPIESRKKINNFNNNESKIHSTTMNGTGLGLKWTYTQPPTTNQSTSKSGRRRSKKIKEETEVFSSTMESPLSNPSRKERSLHYCNICNKGFKDKYSVTVHVRCHTGEKPFACSLCGKHFRQKAHLAKHYQTHAAKAMATGRQQLKRSSL